MEKIIENIADLTAEYSKNIDQPDESYLKELTHIIVSEDDLEDYVKSILIKKLSCYSYYEVRDGIIYFDLNRQLKSFDDETQDFYNNASEKEIKGGKFLYVAQMLLHECEHGHQFKKCCEKGSDIETKILSSIYKWYLPNGDTKSLSLFAQFVEQLNNILDDILYNHYYEYAPEDRLADISSYKRTLKIAKLLGLNCSYNYHLTMLYDTYLDSYDQNEPPTIYYFMKTRRRELDEELKNSSDLLDFDTRLDLGLYLTKKEKKKLEHTRYKI